MYQRGHGKRGAKRERKRPPMPSAERADKQRQQEKKQEAEARRERLRDAVPADWSKLRHWSTYEPLPEFYFDQKFSCRDCGKFQVWTAAQQKWYFEVAKGKMGGKAIRCRECRRKHREQGNPLGRRGDPMPVKHPAVLMKRLREALEDNLAGSGFVRGERGSSRQQRRWWFEFERGEETLAFSFQYRCHGGRLLAEYANVACEIITVAEIERGAMYEANIESEVMEKFCGQIREFLGGLSSEREEL